MLPNDQYYGKFKIQKRSLRKEVEMAQANQTIAEYKFKELRLKIWGIRICVLAVGLSVSLLIVVLGGKFFAKTNDWLFAIFMLGAWYLGYKIATYIQPLNEMFKSNPKKSPFHMPVLAISFLLIGAASGIAISLICFLAYPFVAG